MRAYELIIDGVTIVDAYSNLNGLQIESDIDANAAQVSIATEVRVSNYAPLNTRSIREVQGLYGKYCILKGGFAKGLPLALPEKYGIIANGTITSATYDINGTMIDLIFWLYPIPKKQSFVIFKVAANTSLATAIRTALLPFSLVLNFSTQLQTLQSKYAFGCQYASLLEAINGICQQFNLKVTNTGQGQYLWTLRDEAISPAIITIPLNQIIGQTPTLDPVTIAVQTTLDYRLRQGVIVRVNSRFSSYLSWSRSVNSQINMLDPIINGEYLITQCRHTLNYKGVEAQTWATQIWAIKTNSIIQ